jgi:hypothetical protein
MGSSLGPTIVHDTSLVALYDAADAYSYQSGSSTNWFDLSGNGADMTQLGAAINPSSSNLTVLPFNGTSQGFRQTTSPSFKFATGTILVWAKQTGPAVSGSTGQYIIKKDNQYLIKNLDQKLTMDDTTYHQNSSSFLLYDNTWHHLAISVSEPAPVSGSGTLYLDAVPILTGSMWINGSIGNGGISVGYDRVAVNAFWPGFMSSIQFYNRILSIDEIRQNYNATKGRFGL